MKLPAALVFLLMIQQLSFKQTQLQHSRVRLAYQEKESTVKNYFNQRNLNNQGAKLFLRAFKKEMKLEVWVQTKQQQAFQLLHTYDFCATSGRPGPKRKEGDSQIPEGIYYIKHFNPVSNFHLSLGLNYPNKSDKILGDKNAPGSDIYIHGNCVTIGCIPVTDDKIKELYILAVDARESGQKEIPVHIFPARLDQTGMLTLRNEFSSQPELITFWENLATVYKNFQDTHMLKPISIDVSGRYRF
jgi:murein L,D-transpeptidase YafK